MTEENKELSQEQKEFQNKLQNKLDQVASEAYKAGAADAFIQSVKSLTEVRDYLNSNIESVSRYLKEELNAGQQLADALNEDTDNVEDAPVNPVKDNKE